MEIKWEEGAEISVRVEKNATVVAGNREGLITLGYLLINLAGQEVGKHVHLDEGNGLKEGSSEIVLEKVA